MSNRTSKEFVVDHWYFLNPSEVRTKRYGASTYEDAVTRAESLVGMSNTSKVKVSKRGHGRTVNVLKVWQK